MTRYLMIAVTCMGLAACTQGATPTTTDSASPGTTQGAGSMPAAVAAAGGSAATAPTTPPLSIVDDGLAAVAKGPWCLKDGTAPFTKIVINDSSIVAPIENQSAGRTVTKDTGTQQAPGTGTTTSAGNNSFQIKWLRAGISGTATIQVVGDSLQFVDESGTGSFSRCP